MFILCNDETSLSSALLHLSQASCVFLDCEGRDLGTQDGALSIVSLGALHSDIVYLIDVVVLPPNLSQLIYQFLEQNAHMKVVWDGRMDFSELFFGHSTAIDANILDLQLVDIVSRTVRGECDQKRKQRLIGRLPFRTRKLQIDGLHALCSLDRALREHNVTNVATKDVNVKKAHSSNSSDMWMKRPLTDDLLSYAASDIERIAALYTRFSEAGYLGTSHLPELLSQSAKYVGLYRRTGRPSSTDRFKCSGLLPLGILQSKEVGPEDSLCDCCERVLAVDCFPKSQQTQSNIRCRACVFISARAEYMTANRREKKEIDTSGMKDVRVW